MGDEAKDRREVIADVIHWTAPWEMPGYQPPDTYEGALQLADVIVRELDRIDSAATS